MTSVKELIEYLQTLNPESRVMCLVDRDDEDVAEFEHMWIENDIEVSPSCVRIGYIY